MRGTRCSFAADHSYSMSADLGGNFRDRYSRFVWEYPGPLQVFWAGMSNVGIFGAHDQTEGMSLEFPLLKNNEFLCGNGL